ncbi:MAG: 2-phosphosulfolactate phosphatase [Pirellulales bacterium]
MPELRVHNLPQQIAPEALALSTVVVIDLLRATSTICQALAAGATEVVPFLEIDEAFAAAAADRANIVLGGERHGHRIEGFDLGNSPSEYTPGTVGGKRVFITTTNGTRALYHARQAKRVLAGSFLNLSALVVSVQNAPRVEFLCAGTDGVESREDILAAGAMLEKLLDKPGAEWQLDSGAKNALHEWQSRGSDLAVELRTTPGGSNLLEIGHDHDLIDCARTDALTVVPELDVAAWRITAR